MVKQHKMDFQEMESKLKSKSHNGKICVRFFDAEARGGEGEYTDTVYIDASHFNETGDLILDVQLT